MRPENGHVRPILVVDDDNDLSRMVARALMPLGHEVLCAGTAAEALATARRERPCAVVLDIRLPDLSGYEVCRQLRDEFGQSLPIVFVSGCRTEDIDRAAGLIVGADDYVVKPFDVGELVARVRRAIARTAPEGGTADGVLTNREREVLRLLAQGLTQDAIATRLFITANTAATHIQHILTKLDLHSRAEAVAFAHRHGVGTTVEHGASSTTSA